MATITIRVRYSGGTLRIADARPTWTLEELKTKIRSTLAIADNIPVILSPNPPSQSTMETEEYLDDSLTLKELGLSHGSLLFMESKYFTNTVAAPPGTTAQGKQIDPEGNIILSKKSTDSAAFRPGVMSLRAQKMHWTLTEMTELEDKYTFVFRGKEPIYTESASLDLQVAQEFQRYCGSFSFRRPRCALLYGRFEDVNPDKAAEDEAAAKLKRYGETKGRMRVSDFKAEDDKKADKKVVIDCMYEPKQELKNGAIDFSINWNDEGIKVSNEVAKLFGMTCVGIIFSHPPGRQDYHFSANEVAESGLACLEATNGSINSPFSIIKVTPSDEGIQMDAFQLTSTCLDMIINDALLKMPGRPGFFAVNEKFTAIVEAKSAEVIDTDFLIKRVPIKSHNSKLSTGFPKANRDDEKQLSSSLKSIISKNQKNPAELRKALMDFNLLIFIAKSLGVDTVGQLVENLVNSPPTEPVPEGFLLIMQNF